MKLFSEKVTPTFTSSNQNILTVKDYSEIFFDVFELEINGNKYIAEKVSEYKGSPVVNIPIVIEGKELEAPFVLQCGSFEVLYNALNNTILESTSADLFSASEARDREEELEGIIFEKKESILEEIQQARKSASDFVESARRQNLRELKESSLRERKAFFESKEKFKTDLLEEFLQLSNTTREELVEYNEQESTRAYNFIVDSINNLSDKLALDLESTFQEQNTQSIELFENKITELAKNILTDNLLKEIEKKDIYNNKNLNIKFDTVSKSLTKVLGDWKVNVAESVQGVVSKFDNTIITLEQANIELSDSINKSSNKALSRIGNVKTQLEESIAGVSSELVNKITLAEDRIKEYYNDRITLIEANVTDITIKDKAHIIKLIEESKQTILDEVATIRNNVPSVIVEKTLETKGDVDVKSIKTDLEKNISNRFTQELASVRRLIELSSGGGSVAVQFANGGTMNGDLNVTGQILSGGINIFSLLSSPYNLIDVTSSIQPKRGNNIASGTRSNVAGGCCNTASGYMSNVANGRDNIACNSYSNVAGGRGSTASGQYSNVAGGGFNTASGIFSGVLGGNQNTASGYMSNVTGGKANTASGYYSNVAGGKNNTTSKGWAVIGGGDNNTASGYWSTIAGGAQNSTTGDEAAIGGGCSHSATGTGSTIAGGRSNLASGNKSTVSGGGYNTASGYVSNVAGGCCNTASGYVSNVAGGCCNTASGCYSGILGGCSNTVSHDNSFIVGSNITSTAACTTYMNNVTVCSIACANSFCSTTDFESVSISSGVILKSPDGTRWRVTINNSGALVTTSI